MCGCGGSTQPAAPPQQITTPQTITGPDGSTVTVTQVGPSAPGYFWTGPPGYNEAPAEPAPAASE